MAIGDHWSVAGKYYGVVSYRHHFIELSMRMSLLGLAACIAGAVCPPALRAAEPEVTVKTDKGWIKTTYTISMNREAAEKLRDAVNRADPKMIGGALTTAAPDPAMKIAIALVTGKDAFKRAINKDGAIGSGGLTITLTAYGGWVAKNVPGPIGDPPLPLEVVGAVCDAMQVAVNPWSWSIAPRK